MLNKKTVAVIIPAYNEEKQIEQVLNSLPSFIDRIVVINDCSKDNTKSVVEKYIDKNQKNKIFKKTTIKNSIKTIKKNKYNRADILAKQKEDKEIKYFIPSEVYNKNSEKDRVILISNLKNGGVGTALARGYKWCKDHNIDCTVSMDGDSQMDPGELESLCMPVVKDGVDFVKGNRLIHRSALLVIPKIRYIGNSILSLLTKIASGYWHISDSQCGYTAMSIKALKAIRIHKLYKDYGVPNDRIIKLNIAFCTIKEVEVKPIYKVGERSTMKIFKVIPKISLLLFKSFFKRLWIKYFFRDFHPLFLLYNFAFILFIINIPVGIKIINQLLIGKPLTYQSLIVFIFLSISGFQSLLFAMWMDMQDNERLQK